MKLLLALTLLYSGICSAGSRIGEWAAYEYEETTKISTIKGTLVKEIIDEKKMQSPAGKSINYVKVSEKFNFEAEDKEVSKWIPESEYLNSFELNLYMLKCRFSKNVGEIEALKVKAGQFSSCKIKDQETWISIVPFNVVLSISNDGTTFRRAELVKFSWKKKPQI